LLLHDLRHKYETPSQAQAVSETRIPQEKPRDASYVHPCRLHAGAGPLWVCEGALTRWRLLRGGVSRVVAIFGVHGYVDWGARVRTLVFASR